jgi:hypothetical protein
MRIVYRVGGPVEILNIPGFDKGMAKTQQTTGLLQWPARVPASAAYRVLLSDSAGDGEGDDAGSWPEADAAAARMRRTAIRRRFIVLLCKEEVRPGSVALCCPHQSQ